MKKYIIIVFISLAGISGCNQQKVEVVIGAEKLHEAMQKLTDVIVFDIFSPPVASRIYSYPSIAAYEILCSGNSAYKSLSGQLTDLEPIPEPKSEINIDIAAVEAFLIVGRNFIFSEEKIDVYRLAWHEDLEKTGIDDDELVNSLNYANTVADHIIEWSSKDNYKQSRTFQKHSISDQVETWQPTPPAYMEAIEPHWSQIRPFVIDSATQFVPERPTEFDLTEGSDFYKEIMEVYQVGKNLDSERSEIASFWDCNPYVMNVRGHVMFATKKITPGGHWISITKIACEKANSSLIAAAEAYSLASISLADAFISCWDEKYRSNLIRPETIINRHIDEDWMPLLQTPPFPEYTSGHSVASGSVSTMLTHLFGDDFSFNDDSEMVYGLPMRSYKSFNAAADEAAISRLYGGIHYMPAITNGLSQGRAIGDFIVANMSTKQ